MAQPLADQPSGAGAELQGQPARLLERSGSFCTLFMLSLFAEFIANDRPLLVRYKGETLFPVAVNYPERSSAASSQPPTIAIRSSPRRSRPMAGHPVAADPLFLQHA
jgi:hypothetical protein